MKYIRRNKNSCIRRYIERIFASNLLHQDRKPKYVNKSKKKKGGDGKWRTPTLVMEWRPGVTAWWVWARRPPRWRTCRYGRSTPGSKRPAKPELRLDKELHVAVRCIFARSLQVNLSIPAVCHGTLRISPWGVTVTDQGPPKTLYSYTWSHSRLKGGICRYFETKDHGKKK